MPRAPYVISSADHGIVAGRFYKVALSVTLDGGGPDFYRTFRESCDTLAYTLAHRDVETGSLQAMLRIDPTYDELHQNTIVRVTGSVVNETCGGIAQHGYPVEVISPASVERHKTGWIADSVFL